MLHVLGLRFAASARVQVYGLQGITRRQGPIAPDQKQGEGAVCRTG